MKIKKAVSEMQLEREQLIATPYGSLVQTYLILNGIEWTDGEFVKKFKKAKFPFMEDKQFLRKTLEAVGLSYDLIKNKPVALCENEFNTIFCPFIVGELEYGQEVVLLPLFKNRDLLRSQEIAMANDTYKIIDWSEEDE